MRQPIDHVYQSIQGYCQQYGFPPVLEGFYGQVDEAAAHEIAILYESLPVIDGQQSVQQAYASLVQEVTAQWDYALTDGYVFEPWNHEGQPYANSAEMIVDVREHHHLFFFRGGEPHPYLEAVDTALYTSTEMLRAVHDLYGHAAEGYSFGPRGEHNAWLKHSQMFSPLAQRALTTETRGQNSWFNFGPYCFLPPSTRPFPIQKAALLPMRLCAWQQLLCR